jgi:hypothetical protein
VLIFLDGLIELERFFVMTAEQGDCDTRHSHTVLFFSSLGFDLTTAATEEGPLQPGMFRS